MSTCSSRISDSSRSSGPENAVSSTTKPDSVAPIAPEYGGVATLIGSLPSAEPLVQRRQRVRVRPLEQEPAERKGGPHPVREKTAAESEQEHEDHDAVPAKLLIAQRPRRRQQVLHHVRPVERRNGNQVEGEQHEI